MILIEDTDLIRVRRKERREARKLAKLSANFLPDQEWLRNHYILFNKEYFNNELQIIPKFIMNNMKGATGQAVVYYSRFQTPDFNIKTKDGLFAGDTAIKISTYFNTMDEHQYECVLLHEMIHIYQYYMLPKSEWARDAHGYTFEHWIDIINAKSDGKYIITKTNTISYHKFGESVKFYLIINKPDIKKSPKQAGKYQVRLIKSSDFEDLAKDRGFYHFVGGRVYIYSVNGDNAEKFHIRVFKPDQFNKFYPFRPEEIEKLVNDPDLTFEFSYVYNGDNMGEKENISLKNHIDEKKKRETDNKDPLKTQIKEIDFNTVEVTVS